MNQQLHSYLRFA